MHEKVVGGLVRIKRKWRTAFIPGQRKVNFSEVPCCRNNANSLKVLYQDILERKEINENDHEFTDSHLITSIFTGRNQVIAILNQELKGKNRGNKAKHTPQRWTVDT